MSSNELCEVMIDPPDKADLCALIDLLVEESEEELAETVRFCLRENVFPKKDFSGFGAWNWYESSLDPERTHKVCTRDCFRPVDRLAREKGENTRGLKHALRRLAFVLAEEAQKGVLNGRK